MNFTNIVHYPMDSVQASSPSNVLGNTSETAFSKLCNPRLPRKPMPGLDGWCTDILSGALGSPLSFHQFASVLV